MIIEQQKLTEEDVYEKVMNILNDEGWLEDGVFSTQTNLHDDLGIDSLDRLELIMEIESKFLISVPDDKIEKIFTVGDLVDVVWDKIENKN